MDATLSSSEVAARSSSISDALSAERIRQELSRLCADQLFLRSPVSVRLLSFLIEEDLAGRSTDLKESTIGNGLYGRPPTYDTKGDAVVRVNANRLRLRLDEYYSIRTHADVRIILNKGSYVPTYRFASPEHANFNAPNATEVASPVLSVGSINGDGTNASARPPLRWLLSGILAGLMCTGLLLWVLHIRPWRAGTQGTEVSWSVRPFTRLAGSQNFASFSPDGTTVAFAWRPADTKFSDIFVQGVSSTTPRPLVSGPGEYDRPSWSPDGKKLAYVQTQLDGGVDIWFLDLWTGQRVKLISLKEPQTWLCLRPRLTWAVDGRTLITSAAYSGSQACGIVAIDVMTRALRQITEPTTGILGDVEAAVSPSGDSIAFIRTFSFMRSDLFTIPIYGGAPHRVTFDQRDLLGFAWASSGRFFYTASRRVDGVLRLWQVQWNGAARQLTDGSATAAFPAVSRDGKRIVFTDYRNVIDFLLLRDRKTTQIVANNSEDSDAEVSPDGKYLLYGSDQSGAVELWISDLDGTNQHKIAGSSIVSGRYASWSADGKKIAFECRNKVVSGVCMMDWDGSHVEHLTDSRSSCLLPTWTRDGKSVYYTSKVSGAYQIYRQPLDGSPPVQITRHGGMRAIEALDGRSVFVHRGPIMPGIARLPLDGRGAAREFAESHPLLELPARNDWSDWNISRDAIFYVTRGQGDRVYRYDLNTRRRTPLAALKSLPAQSGRILSVSQDNLSLILEQQTYSAQLDLMTLH